jgi:hypothetical protein
MSRPASCRGTPVVSSTDRTKVKNFGQCFALACEFDILANQSYWSSRHDGDYDCRCTEASTDYGCRVGGRCCSDQTNDRYNNATLLSNGSLRRILLSTVQSI